MRGRNIALVAILTLFVTSCDQSGAPTDTAYDGPPPARFQADGEATRVVFVSDVETACRKAGLKIIPGTFIQACSLVGAGRREIIVENPCGRTRSYARTMCHELGHLNGWPGDHGS